MPLFAFLPCLHRRARRTSCSAGRPFHDVNSTRVGPSLPEPVSSTKTRTKSRRGVVCRLRITKIDEYDDVPAPLNTRAWHRAKAPLSESSPSTYHRSHDARTITSGRPSLSRSEPHRASTSSPQSKGRHTGPRPLLGATARKSFIIILSVLL